MKKTARLLAMIVAMARIFSMLPLSIFAAEGDELSLEFTSNGDGTCYVTGVDNSGDVITEIVIPSVSPDGDVVIGIGDYALYYGNMLSVQIPASVEYIGNYALGYCSSLAEVIFEEDSNLNSI